MENINASPNQNLYPETPNFDPPQASQNFRGLDIKMLLPLLQGGSNPTELLKALTPNLSPQMTQVMSLLNAQNSLQGKKNKPRAKAPDYISVEEYYKTH